jgi:N-carbamoylputrescine amidase
MSRFTLGLVQMAPGRDVQESVEKAVGRVAEAAAKGARLVCLPELFATQYFCQAEEHANFDMAQPVPGPITERMAQAARASGVSIVVPLFEKRAPGVYHNSLVVIGPEGQVLGHYRKMHIPDDPGFYEKFYFSPGDLGFMAVDTPVGHVGTLICWDQWFPEAARLTSMAGAVLLVYPTAIGWHPAEKEQFGHEQREAWMIIQRAHAIANGVYVAAINRVGHEKPARGGDGIEFWGSSFVAGPFGTIIAQGSVDREEIVLAEIDPAQVDEKRTHWPFLRDRRIDAYGDLTKRFIR